MTLETYRVISLPKKLIQIRVVNRPCMEDDNHHCRGRWFGRIMQIHCVCDCHFNLEQNKRLYAKGVQLIQRTNAYTAAGKNPNV
jgi:hypothetical protein